MKHYDVYGMGNALLDILVKIEEAEFQALDVERGTMRLVDVDSQKALLERFHHHRPHLVSGGSVGNSTIALAQLGGKAAFCGCVADDRYGLYYKGELEQLGIDMPSSPLVGEATGTCVSMITPDAERTMRTCLAAAELLSEDDVDEETVRRSKWIFIEGYLLANPGKAGDAIRKAVEAAKRFDTKVAVTFSESWVVDSFRDKVDWVAERSDLVFANASEACSFAGDSEPSRAFTRLADRFPYVAVTLGGEGALVSLAGETARIPAFDCSPTDLTGAGDMFAGALLYGITHSYSAQDAGTAACYLASRVISQVGARLHTGVRDLWDEALTLRR